MNTITQNTKITSTDINTLIEECNNKLSLSGGTMAGPIKRNGGDVLLNASPNGAIYLCGGETRSTGSYIMLKPKDHSNNEGEILLSTVSADGTVRELNIRADGMFTWGGLIVERVTNISTDYIRFESGLQICWGNKGATSAEPETVTFPAAFSANPSVIITRSGSNYQSGWIVRSTTKFVLYTNAIEAAGFDWIAIGKWK